MRDASTMARVSVGSKAQLTLRNWHSSIITSLNLTHDRPTMPFEDKNISEDLFSSVMSQLIKKYYTSENLKFINLGILKP